MGYEVHFMFDRSISAEDGQKRLKAIHDAGKKLNAAGVMKLETPETLNSNPFPVWFCGMIVPVDGVIYDDINFVYSKKCEKLEEARSFEAWFDSVKKWVQDMPEDEKLNYSEISKISLKIFETTGANLKEENVELF